MYGYIYKISLDDVVIYVGQHKQSKFDENYFGSGVRIKNYIKKHGKSNLKCQVLEWCDSKEELNFAEIYWIETLSKEYHLWNIAKGGYLYPLEFKTEEEVNDIISRMSIGVKEWWTEERRHEKSLYMKKYYSEHPERRQQCASVKSQESIELQKEKVKKWCSENKEKMSNSTKKLWQDDSYRQTQINSHKGYITPDKTKQLISEKLKGNNQGCKWYNNGIIQVLRKECPDGFKEGCLPCPEKNKSKGTKWYNNGVYNVRRLECPEGFVPGMIVNTNSGKFQEITDK